MSWRPSSISRAAALGDLERRGERLGPLGERLRHLLRGLQEELVRLEGHLRRLQRRLRLHAQQRRVVVVVLAPEVVHVGRADERAAELARDLDDPLVRLVLQRETVLLHLEEHVVGPEDAEQVLRVGARIVHPTVGDPLAEAAGEAAGEGDDALAVALEQPEVDGGLPALQALEEARGRQPHEVAIALVALREEREVIALRAARATGRPCDRRRGRPRSRRSA